jgi:alanine dehydrogenase
LSTATSAQPNPVLVLTKADVKRLLTLGECIQAVEEAFRSLGEGRAPAPGILGTHVDGGGFHVKAGVMHAHDGSFYAVKVNANFPGNPSVGLPTIQGAVLLFDAVRGIPLAIMDSIEITAMRTGAASAVAAKYLARKHSEVATVIGCGLQGRVQLQSLLQVLPITRVFAYDIDPNRSQAYAREQSSALGIEVSAVRSTNEAAPQSDVIVTCTTAKKPVLSVDEVHRGTFIAAVGADNEDKQELDPRLLAEHTVVPDVLSQAASIGELHHAIRAGLLTQDAILPDLGSIVAGKAQGRHSDDEITIFDSTGMALQDVAAAIAVYRKAAASKESTRIMLNS